MKTKEEIQSDSVLVRSLVPRLKRKTWMPDQDRALRIALAKRVLTELPQLEMTHLLRIDEAAQEMEFEEPEMAGFRHSVGCELARRLDLKKYRTVILPTIATRPPQKQ